MSDSSEGEDLSKFKEAVDSSFAKLIYNRDGDINSKKDEPKPKSERYLEVASHYNDVKVPKEMQNKIGAKVSAIISKNIEFVEVHNGVKKKKVKGGVKLFSGSSGFLTCEDPIDTYAGSHNQSAKHVERKRRQVEVDDLDDNQKVKAVALSGDYILSKEETKCWKSRRKDKIYKFKGRENSNVLTAVE